MEYLDGPLWINKSAENALKEVKRELLDTAKDRVSDTERAEAFSKLMASLEIERQELIRLSEPMGFDEYEFAVTELLSNRTQAYTLKGGQWPTTTAGGVIDYLTGETLWFDNAEGRMNYERRRAFAVGKEVFEEVYEHQIWPILGNTAVSLHIRFVTDKERTKLRMVSSVTVGRELTQAGVGHWNRRTNKWER